VEDNKLDARQRIYQVIRKTPGIHLRELQKTANVSSMGNLEYHLDYLEKAKLVTSESDGNYKRFFGTKEDPYLIKKLGLLRQEIPRQITIFLLLNPEATHKQILENFEIAPSTLSFHLNKMYEQEIVNRHREGRNIHYTIENPNLLAKVLITYKPTFLDKLVDNFVDVWEF